MEKYRYLLLLPFLILLIILIISCDSLFNNPVDSDVDIGKIDSLKIDALDDSRIQLVWDKNSDVFTYVIKRRENSHENWQSIIPPEKNYLDTTFIDSLLKYQSNNEEIIYEYQLYGKCDENKTKVVKDSLTTYFPKPSNFHGEQKGHNKIILHWNQEIFSDKLEGFILKRKDNITALKANYVSTILKNKEKKDYVVIDTINAIQDSTYSDEDLTEGCYSFSYKIQAFTVEYDTTTNSNTIFNKSLYAQTDVVRSFMTVDPLDTLNFNEVYVDSISNSKEIVITNISESVIKVNDISISGDNDDQFDLNATDTPFDLNPEMSEYIYINFEPDFAGLKEAFLQISNDIPNDDKMIYKVPLQGTGINPSLEIDPSDSLKFGEIRLEETSEKKVTLSNLGFGQIRITDINIHSLDSVFSIKENSGIDTLGADESKEINIEFNPEDTLNYSAKLTIKDDLRRMYEVELCGKGVSPKLSISMTEVNFGKIIIGNDSTMTLKLTNTGTGELSINEIEIINDTTNSYSYASDPPAPFIIDEEDSVLIDVTFQPNSDDYFAAILKISDDVDRQEKEEHSIILLGVGTYIGLYISDHNLDFDSLYVDSTATDTIYLKNVGDDNLTITSITLEDDTTSFAIEYGWSLPQLIDAGDSVGVDVEFAPESAGAKSATIEIKDDQSEKGRNEYNISLLGTGLESSLEISPEEINFGELAVGTRDTSEVEISNTGNTEVEITSISLTGTDTTDFAYNGTNGTVGIGESDTVFVIFKPGTSGEKEAELEIEDDINTEPTTVDLSGIGTEGVLVINPSDTLDFSDVGVGVTSEGRITLKNTGNGTLELEDFDILGTDSVYFDYDMSYLLPFELSAGDSIFVDIAFTPDTTKIYNADFRVTAGDGVHELPLRGRGVKQELEFEPDSLYFGFVDVGDDSTSIISIHNKSDLTIKITSVHVYGSSSFEDSLINWAPEYELLSGDSLNISIEFNPTSIGLEEASLVVVVNTKNKNKENFSADLKGYGVEGELTVADSLNFGSVEIDSTSLETLILENIGDGILTITDISIASGDTSIFNYTPPSDTTLSSGDELDLEIEFSPQDTTSYSDTLKIWDDVNRNLHEVNLKGLGTSNKLNEKQNYSSQSLHQKKNNKRRF